MKKVRSRTRWKPYEGDKHDKSMWDSPKDGPGVLYKQLPQVLRIINKNPRKSKHSVFKIIKEEFERKNLSTPRLSDSRIRTIVALGRKFGLIKTSRSKSTNLELTQAGKESISGNYVSSIERQYIKLVFNNPMLRNSKGIEVFPIIILMEILIKTDYLTREEVAYFLFASFKNKRQLKDTVAEIFKFRDIEEEEQRKIIERFKETHKGNITLKKASSVGYLFSNLNETRLFEVSKNKNKIFLTDKQKAQEIVDKYKLQEYFEFDKHYWEIYYGNHKISFPPKMVPFRSSDPNQELYLLLSNQIYEENWKKITNEIKIPVFSDLENKIRIHNPQGNEEFLIENFSHDSQNIIDISSLNPNPGPPLTELLEYYKGDNLDPKLTERLTIYKKKATPNIRGARFEYLVYKFLEENLSSLQVIWNGTPDKDEIFERPAPGGKPDIVVISDSYSYIVETTTIKNRSGQETSETFSLLRHAKDEKAYLEQGRKVKIIFISPVKYPSLNKSMDNMVSRENIEYQNIDIDELIDDYADIFA